MANRQNALQTLSDHIDTLTASCNQLEANDVALQGIIQGRVITQLQQSNQRLQQKNQRQDQTIQLILSSLENNGRAIKQTAGTMYDEFKTGERNVSQRMRKELRQYWPS